MDILEILEIELPCDSARAVLVISLKGSKETYHRDTCTPTITRKWNKPRCPLAEDWAKEVSHRLTMTV